MKAFLTIFLVTIQVHADNELRLKALKEAEAPRVQQEKASEATVEVDTENAPGVLTLEDPTPNLKTRTYDWIFGLKVQSYQPSGQLSSPETTYYLSEQSPYFLPSLEFGIRFAGPETETAQWKWGLTGHGGYSSQESRVTFYSSNEDAGKLTTLLTDVGLIVEQNFLGRDWGWHVGAGAGSVTYSHSGSSSFSQLSETATYRFAAAGVHWNLPSWQVLLTYNNRNLIQEDELISIPTDSVELGTRFIW